jgi:hypothetical protein
MLILAVLDGLQVQWLLNPQLDVVAVLGRFARLVDGADTHEASIHERRTWGGPASVGQ